MDCEVKVLRTFKITVSGMVQGVGFRYFVLRCARNYNLNGYVRNLPGGKVEVVVTCDGEVPGDFLIDLKNGPAYADVTTVVTEEISGKIFDSFNIVP